MQTESRHLSAEHAAIVAEIQQHYRQYRFISGQRRRLEGALLAFTRNALGYDLATMSKAEIAACAKSAKDLLKIPAQIEKEADRETRKLAKAAAKAKPTAAEIDGMAARIEEARQTKRMRAAEQSEAFALIAGAEEATTNFVAPLTLVEVYLYERMVELAEQLPVWTEWGANVDCLTPYGVAVIIGEVGDMFFYTKGESAIFKRLGVGLINYASDDGSSGMFRDHGKFWKTQGRPGKGASKEEWIKHGHSRTRRSVLFQIANPFIQGRGEPYRSIYDRRKAYEVEKAETAGKQVLPAARIKKLDGQNSGVISEGYIHNRAHRYMQKRFVRHFYQAWRRTMCETGQAARVAAPRRADIKRAPSALPIAAE